MISYVTIDYSHRELIVMSTVKQHERASNSSIFLLTSIVESHLWKFSYMKSHSSTSGNFYPSPMRSVCEDTLVDVLVSVCVLALNS